MPQVAYSSITEGQDGDNGGQGNNEASEGREQQQRQQASVETICNDGIDNDGDKLIDLEDVEDCPPLPTPPPIADADDNTNTGEQMPSRETRDRIPPTPPKGILSEPEEPSNETETGIAGSLLQARTCTTTLLSLSITLFYIVNK